MLSDQILSYVRENLAAGFKRSDIEAGLRAAGWDAVDIAAAFMSVSGEAAPAANKAAAVGKVALSSEQQTIDAEVARIQAELKNSPTNKKKSYETGETGIIGFLLRNNLASSKQMANRILIGVALCIGALAIWIFIR